MRSIVSVIDYRSEYHGPRTLRSQSIQRANAIVKVILQVYIHAISIYFPQAT